MPSYRRLQHCAIAISIISVVYNGIEGGLSVGFGFESSSRSLIFFGIQSAIEVVSATMVVWRFRNVAKPGEEHSRVLSPRDLKMEKVVSGSIGGLLLALALGTEVTAIVALSLHQEPDGSDSSLIISATALLLMILIWLPKRYLARALNSSAMQAETTCSLSCIQITIVLFIGSLIFRLWHGGWWVDSTTSILLGILFAREGWNMLRWVRDPAFDGGCDCSSKKTPVLPNDVAAELGEQYRDLCVCCAEKPECNSSDECKCAVPSDVALECCKPVSADGLKCCTHNIIKAPHPNGQAHSPCVGDAVSACSKDLGTRCAASDPCTAKDLALTEDACSGNLAGDVAKKLGTCCNKAQVAKSSSCNK